MRCPTSPRSSGNPFLQRLRRRPMASVGLRPDGVRRIFFKEVMIGDRRKLVAESADSSTGGGARDLRVPHRAFGEFFARMLPGSRIQTGKGRLMKIQVGRLYWSGAQFAQEESAELEYWPPTKARATEGRIARIHALPPLEDPPKGEGPCFLLLVQDDAGKVRAHYVTEKDLGDHRFNRQVAA